MTDFNLSQEETERYSRQLSLPEIGVDGQAKLRQSKVLVVGAGGLGSPVVLYLAAAGVGTIGVIDSDVVDRTNLQRQIIHTTDDINRSKVLSASEKLKRLNPNVEVLTYKMLFDVENATSLVTMYDFIIDATDNPGSKFLINDICTKLGKPYSYGGISRFGGQSMTCLPGTACLRCLFDTLPDESTPVGPIGAVAGIIGSIQAAEAIKYITGAGTLITNSLLTVDCLTMEFNRFNVARHRDCPKCHNSVAMQ